VLSITDVVAISEVKENYLLEKKKKYAKTPKQHFEDIKID